MSNLKATVLRRTKLLGKERNSGDILTSQQLDQMDASTLNALQSQHILRLSDHNDFKLEELEARVEALETKTPAKRRPGRSPKEVE